MADLYELPVLDQPGQMFSTVTNGRKITIRLRYNTVTDRFSMDLSIDEQPALTGVKLVSNVDFLEPFDFDIGKMFVAGVRNAETEPTLAAFAEGRVKLYQYF